MRIVRALLVTGAVTATAVLGTSSVTASAAPKTYAEPSVQQIDSIVKATPSGFAFVHVRYTCSGGDQGTHLFIAVKQGPGVSPENPSSSPSMTAFYSTNYNSDGPGLRIHCDGSSHSQQFRLKNDPYWVNADQNLPLVNGDALVQFCLFDSTSSETSENGTVFDYEMKTVKVVG